MRTHEAAVLGQFDPQAAAYLNSAVHAQGPELQRAREVVQRALPRTARMLDVGCGAGHLSYALASALAEVVALDPSPAMLATVDAAAQRRGLAQIRTRQASADSLPFADARFDVVASRYSAHHWRDVGSALREMRRVVAPGGYLLMIDLMGEESPLLDTHLQAMELLRDPSHVRDYAPSQWRQLLVTTGFDLLEEADWTVRLEFTSWVERMRTPPETVAAIRALQSGAPQEVWDGLALERDGSFSAHTGLFWARATGTPRT